MAISNDQFMTYRAAEAIPAFYVVSLTGNSVNNLATVEKATTSDEPIGVALDDAASGELVAVVPLGRGAVTKIAVEPDETIAINDTVTLSGTTAGTIDSDGTIAIGIAVSGAESGSTAAEVAIVQVQTFFPAVTIST
jgi:hypothetical protein